jgi:Ion transport protein
MIPRFLFAVISNQKFDIFIMMIIMLNMITMALEHYEQPEDFEHALFYVNTAFIIIFTAECLMKLISLRWYYFKQPWNVFDFVVVVVSVLG